MLRPRDGVGEVRPLLEAWLERLDRRLDVEAVVVFGSRARGEHLKSSDIDVVVVSSAVRGVPWDHRIGFLLEDWEGTPALEPLGYAPEDVMALDHLVLVDAVHEGRPLRDRGLWRRAHQRLQERLQDRTLQRTPGGWKIQTTKA